jgi:dihydrofolate synthase / folylpolyglutamate synthase
MQFGEALQYLTSLGHETLAIKLGLRNITLLLEDLDNPHHAYFSVQIAGTNGKGSTAAMLESICNTAGIRTGLFTSPHLHSVTERVRVSGKEITPELFAECATEVRDAAERLLATGAIEAVPTFFEQVTAIALLAFKRMAVEIAILETGMGGRLDATTAAGAQLVAITPIALDHEQYLGQTIASIAAEKAAIIHPGVAAVVAPQSDEALQVIEKRALECGVELFLNDLRSTIEGFSDDGAAQVTFETPSNRYESVLLNLRGRHQIDNAGVAIRLAESLNNFGFHISHDAIKKGLATVHHPGRLELIKTDPMILLDGAHNPSGALALRQYLDEFVKRPVTLVFGAMRDKRLSEIAQLLFPAAERLVLTRPDNPRAASLEDLRDLAEQITPTKQIGVAETAEEAFRAANEQTAAGGLICISGSLYLIGEFLSARSFASHKHS